MSLGLRISPYSTGFDHVLTSSVDVQCSKAGNCQKDVREATKDSKETIFLFNDDNVGFVIFSDDAAYSIASRFK